MSLKTKLAGFTLDNPLMPASGPLVGDFDKLEFMRVSGCGAVVTKTISTKEPHIPKPCIYGDKEYVMNSELWSEHSKERWVNEFLPEFKKNKDRPLIISVGYSKEDMAVLIPLLEPFADMFEVSTHYVGKDIQVIKDIVLEIRKHTAKPLFMKISPHIPSPVDFAKAVLEAGATGLVAVNSLGPTMKIDIEKRQIVYGNSEGFVWTSGPSIKPVALATIYKIKQALPEMPIIGVGGIKNADDVIEFLLAGAEAVQMLSAALLKGKDLYKRIISDLPAALAKYGFSSIEEVKATTLSNPVEYIGKVPKLIEEKCTKCMLCKNICPYFAIDFKDKITFDETLCFRCGLCVSKCPVKAITV